MPNELDVRGQTLQICTKIAESSTFKPMQFAHLT